jgi:hypothetical protein
VDGGRSRLELCGSAAGRRGGAVAEEVRRLGLEESGGSGWRRAAARVWRTPAPRGSRQQMSCNF